MDARKKLYEIKMKLIAGLITYDEASKQAKSSIDELNAKGKEIAKKHGMKYHETTFSMQMR